MRKIKMVLNKFMAITTGELYLPEMQDRTYFILSESRQVFQCGLFRYHLPQQERQAANGQTDY